MGRKRLEDGEKKSGHTIRVRADIGVMLNWITRIRGGGTAEFLDPIVRPVVIAKYAQLLPVIRGMKAAEDEARAAEGLPPSDPLPEVVIVEVPAPEPEKKPKRKA